MKPEGTWARFRKYLSPPVFPDDEEKTQIADLLNAVLLSVLFVALVFGIPAVLLTPTLERFLVELGLVLTMFGLLTLLRRGQVRLASILFSSAALVVVSAGVYFAGGFRGSTMSAYFGIVLIAGLLLGSRAALAFGLVAVIFTGWLVYADAQRLLPHVPASENLLALWYEFSAILILMVGLFALVMNNLKLAHERTKRKEKELGFKVVESQQIAMWAQEASDFKTHLLARVSHELRTPLGVILGMAEMLELEAYGPVTDGQKKLLARIQVNSKYLESTVSELLEQSQLDLELLPMQSIWFSPVELLNKTSPGFRREAEGKGLQFQERIAPDLPESLWGPPSQVEQVLYHLIGNAIKFTKTGSICVDLFCPDKANWAIRVTDTGIGIPLEHQDTIFEPFRQVDESIVRENGGMGLGLSIVKRLVTAMKGTIRLESEPGRGSVFSVVIPLADSNTGSNGPGEDNRYG